MKKFSGILGRNEKEPLFEMNRITFFIISAAIHGIILIILAVSTIGIRQSQEETYISIFLRDDKPVIKEWMIAPVIKPQMSEKAYKDGIVWYQEAIKRNHVEYLTDDYQYMIANIYDKYLVIKETGGFVGIFR